MKQAAFPHLLEALHGWLRAKYGINDCFALRETDVVFMTPEGGLIPDNDRLFLSNHFTQRSDPTLPFKGVAVTKKKGRIPALKVHLTMKREVHQTLLTWISKAEMEQERAAFMRDPSVEGLSYDQAQQAFDMTNVCFAFVFSSN